MAKQIDPERRKLIGQVLEYWYTVDFLNQGALQTEQTRRDKENYAFTMSHPLQFGSLYRHEFLPEGEDILARIRQLQNQIDERKRAVSEKEKRGDPPGCCHGRITVCVGSVNRAYLSNGIAALLDCDPPLNPSADRLALASFQLTDEGKYIRETFSLSPVVWAVRRIADRKPGASMYEVLDPDEYKGAKAGFEPDDKTPVTSYEDLRKITDEVIAQTMGPLHPREDADVRPDIHCSYSIYRNAEEQLKRENEDYYGLSMSFYAADLAGFRKTAEDDRWLDSPMWNALIDYICAPYDMAHGAGRERHDLSVSALRDPDRAAQTRECFRRILSVDRSPWGKWPSRYRPFFMQQAAVNLAINTDEPLFAVNGPPGTGKTTLLREIVADCVVQKARILSGYEKPDDMFVSGEFQIGANKQYYYSFRPDMKEDIRRYGIVVASSNNAAVENISKQLPLWESLDKNLRGSGDRAVERTRDLFSPEKAARERVRRKNFEKEGQPVETVELPDIYFTSYAAALMREPCWGLISAPLGRRGNIVAFYNRVIKQLHWDFFRDYDFCRNRLPGYQAARREFRLQLAVVGNLQEELQREVARAERGGLPSAGDGEDRFRTLNEDLFAGLASDDTEVRRDAQMSNVRVSDRYDREREKLFHDALILTKEFILSSERCRSNLRLLGMVWGMEPKDSIFLRSSESEKEEIFRKCGASLMQTLQLLVPVISTTFASAGRFFRYVNKPGALGTIIVDEAGQATPQMALRLFSKASRAIVVGDPSQIDPVVPDELAFLESTLDREIGKVYSDKTVSVQKIADFLCPWGGTQTDAFGVSGARWIGVPLYVHSRCVEPMFSISNRLSYGNAMLRITGDPPDEVRQSFCYRTSQWINVAGEEEKEKNHFVRAQGERVLQLLETAFERNAKKTDPDSVKAGPDLFIISPFHTVAEDMRQLISVSLSGRYPALAANREIAENWLIDEQNPHVGTVHTFQGREADEVIFLLGCDEHSRRSANWVNRNIVNVAVSRAKYRLYVIGDVRVWDQCGPIMEMKYDLDAYACDQLASLAREPADDGEMDWRIPELPSAEMFEIEDVSDESGEEYRVEPQSGIRNMQAYVPGFADDFTPEQLQLFGIRSMDEFRTVFSPEIRNLLRTALWNYLWLKPHAGRLPEDYDVSSVGICFCKAFELSLKQNWFFGLRTLLPDVLVKAKPLSGYSPDGLMIGDFMAVITAGQRELAARMARLGHRELDTEWWAALLSRMNECKRFRNSCCHPGRIFTWRQLEQLLDLLFQDSQTGPRGFFGRKRTVHGLLLETSFRDVIRDVFGRTGAQAVPDEENKGLLNR